MCTYTIIQIYSGITRGRVLNGELFMHYIFLKRNYLKGRMFLTGRVYHNHSFRPSNAYNEYIVIVWNMKSNGLFHLGSRFIWYVNFTQNPRWAWEFMVYNALMCQSNTDFRHHNAPKSLQSPVFPRRQTINIRCAVYVYVNNKSDCTFHVLYFWLSEGVIVLHSSGQTKIQEVFYLITGIYAQERPSL